MLGINEIKAGKNILWEDAPYVVLTAEHSKTGRAGAVLRTKLKNLLTGNVLEKTFNGSDKADEADIRGLFEDLTALTKFHFDTESALMLKYCYPRRQEHNIEHGRLLAEVPHFRIRLKKGGDLFVLQSVKDWWLHHIITDDVPLGDFIRQAQSGKSARPSP